MNPNTPVRTVKGSIIGTSDKAYLMLIQEVSGEEPLAVRRKEWFPISQTVKSFRSPLEVDGDWIIVSEWILEKKNLLGVESIRLLPTQVKPAPIGSSASIKENFYDYAKDIDEDDIPF